jgi:hypothetical protein
LNFSLCRQFQWTQKTHIQLLGHSEQLELFQNENNTEKLRIPMSENNPESIKQPSESEVDMSRLVLESLSDGRIYAYAAWKLIDKKSDMGDMDWMAEVGKEAVKMAYAEYFENN